jgi:hypothetical protein
MVSTITHHAGLSACACWQEKGKLQTITNPLVDKQDYLTCHQLYIVKALPAGNS